MPMPENGAFCVKCRLVRDDYEASIVLSDQSTYEKKIKPIRIFILHSRRMSLHSIRYPRVKMPHDRRLCRLDYDKDKLIYC